MFARTTATLYRCCFSNCFVFKLYHLLHGGCWCTSLAVPPTHTRRLQAKHKGKSQIRTKRQLNYCQIVCPLFGQRMPDPGITMASKVQLLYIYIICGTSSSQYPLRNWQCEWCAPFKLWPQYKRHTTPYPYTRGVSLSDLGYCAAQTGMIMSSLRALCVNWGTTTSRRNAAKDCCMAQARCGGLSHRPVWNVYTWRSLALLYSIWMQHARSASVARGKLFTERALLDSVLGRFHNWQSWPSARDTHCLGTSQNSVVICTVCVLTRIGHCTIRKQSKG